ncbi:MAG: hypothetical protein A2017_00935 [Lentisphaerae bacterium GWF2_44_16]|nr:MAG: hypothetical protein A2017_00935 [Lentisphaerae bacterium GWF2_44_16]
MKKIWKIGIIKDRAVPMLGLHGHQVAFRGLPGVEIAALADSNTENLDEIISLIGAKRHYLNHTEMLDKEKPDIVVLCSRHPHDHLPQIKAAAERGIHVYCEKPMTVNLREADQIVEISEKHNIKICVAHPARYDLGFRTMKKMIEMGEIGSPLTIYGRGKNDHRGGGEDLLVLGTHILDLQTFFFGAPDYVMADMTANGRPVVKTDSTKTVEPIGPTAADEIFACFRFPEGVRGIFESRRGLFERSNGIIHMGITVAGTKGALSLRFCDIKPEDKLRISRRPGPLEDNSAYEEVPLTEERRISGAEALDYSLCGKKDICGTKWFLEANRFAAWDLICAIEEDREPVSNAHNARLALEMIYGIYASHLSRGIVNFPLTDRTHPLDK